MSLKDFKPDETKFQDDSPPAEETEPGMVDSGYAEEINTIRIDKLSNKITIISIIIPVMIGAIIVFAYLDMKERVVDVDQTKQSQVDKIARQLEEKLNALDVKIAKNRFDIEEALPKLKEKTTAIEGQMTTLLSAKADARSVAKQFEKLQQQIKNNAGQDKSTLAMVERMNKDTLATIDKNQGKFDQAAKQIKDEITLFKEEFDARLLELSDYEQQIGLIRKDISLLDKKYKRLEQDRMSKSLAQEQHQALKNQIEQIKSSYDVKLKELSSLLNRTQKALDAKTAALERQIRQLSITGKPVSEPIDKPAPEADGPKPQVNIEPAPSKGIKQQPLTQ